VTNETAADASAVVIRPAQPGELSAAGDLRVSAYVAGEFLRPDSGYAPRLRGLGADGTGIVLVAMAGQRMVGTVMLQQWPQGGQVVTGPGEAEIRALAVAPDAQGRGIGRALLRALVAEAARRGVRHLVLSTQPEMRAAHRLYEQEGFERLPNRDWTPEPGVDLLAYGRWLAGPAAGRG